MMPAASHNDLALETPAPCTAVSAGAMVMLAAGMAAAWIAAGSTGLLGHPLQHALVWLALGVAMVAAWPENIRQFGTWAVLALGVGLGIALTASTVPTINVLAVAVVLAAVAQATRLLTRRVALVAALAAAALACFRFACDASPSVWLAADGLGWLLGRVAGVLVGSRLEVGATFGGVDFLVVSAAICAGWAMCTAPPRRRRVLWAVAALGVGHFVYLAALAYSEKLLSLLPPAVVTPVTNSSHLGHWTLAGGLRTLVPWNMPLLAMAIHIAVAVAMVRAAPWLPIIEIDPEKLKRQREREEKEEIPGSVLVRDMLFRFGPPLLAVAAALLGTLSLGPPDLKGKKIVAYEKGNVDWLKPEYNSPLEGRCGMLPALVESLGGKFVKSKDLSAADLEGAAVVVLIHPNTPWPPATLERLWNYVRRGGSLLVAAETAVHEGDLSSTFNDVLQPLAMQVRFDTAVMRASNWEQSYDILAHPATVGIDDLRNRFGIELGSSIRVRWPARPVLAGRWGWSDPGNDAAVSGGANYEAGKPLGDLVLAAEQPLGRGRVFVLGDTTPLKNDALPVAFPFVGRLLAYLAHRPSSPQDWWRQALTLAALAAMLALLAGRPEAWQAMLTPAVMAVALWGGTAAVQWSARVLPDGRALAAGDGAVRHVACIDTSHLEAFDGDSTANHGVNHGISELLRMLMRQGCLPLVVADLTPERLAGCDLLISISPGREFSPAERNAVQQFVQKGGTLLCLAGAEDARGSAGLLADFDLKVPHSPVPPGDTADEPWPLGAIYGLTNPGSHQARFFAAWPVEPIGDNSGAERLAYWSADGLDCHVALRRRIGGGSAILIGDTHLAGNENIEMDPAAAVRFWRWLLSRVAPGEQPWNPPAGAAAPAMDEEE